MHRLRQVLTICLTAMALLTWPALNVAKSQTLADPGPQRALDTSPIRHLLSVMNTIKEENPDYSAILEGLKRLDPKAASDSFLVLVDRNAHNLRIVAAVDTLLASPGYQLCFKQFRNINAEWYRRFLYAIPYRAIDGPGGVGPNLFELFQHQQEVAAWYAGVVSRVDARRCIEIANQWLPPGDYSVPKTYFIYDGNGGAFARDGQVCFDLFAELLWDRPQANRFANLTEIGTEEIEEVLAHEYHHVFANQLFARRDDEDASWQRRRKAGIADAMISEGMALQCNPPQGLKKEIWEDSATARYWVEELNRVFAGVDSGRLSEAQLNDWLSNSFQDTPKHLLVQFLQSRFPSGNLDSLTAANFVHRPDLEHMLGAWMVSHISDGGKNREKVIRLLSQPDSLFGWYNAAIGTGDSTLLVRAKSE